MLSLQWEPEIIAVAVMYLAGRLCKFDIQDWTPKQSSRRWWEQFVQDVPVELLEGAAPEAYLPDTVQKKQKSDMNKLISASLVLQTSATRSWTCTLRETSPSRSRCRRRSGAPRPHSQLLQSPRGRHRPPSCLPSRQRRRPLREGAQRASSNAPMWVRVEPIPTRFVGFNPCANAAEQSLSD